MNSSLCELWSLWLSSRSWSEMIMDMHQYCWKVNSSQWYDEAKFVLNLLFHCRIKIVSCCAGGKIRGTQLADWLNCAESNRCNPGLHHSSWLVMSGHLGTHHARCHVAGQFQQDTKHLATIG
jgi:hypothetical protein